jgi:type II secretory pathway pseudopilin PulG
LRKAFTLIELLVIIGIMGLMVTVGIVNVRSGQGAARVRGATRDIFAVIRHARSTALVTMQPAVVTYSCVMEDGEPVAKIEIHSAKILSSESSDGAVQTLSGEPLPVKDGEDVAAPVAEAAEPEGEAGAKQTGETLEEVLFAPISSEIVKGMRLKVVMGDEDVDFAVASRGKSKVSVFSNVDYLIGKFKSASAAAKKEREGDQDDSGGAADKAPVDSDLQEEVSVVWETNGRTDPHQIWIYPDGSTPEKGLLVKVDRFGGMKVLSGDGSGEDED